MGLSLCSLLGVQFYCNENKKGTHEGFWLIDNQNRKQPFYYTLQNYYRDMKQYTASFEAKNGKPPSDVDMRRQALRILE